jgi:hypothetical protein
MPLKILVGEIRKRRLVQPILPNLRGIEALRNRPHVDVGQRARLLHRQRPIGPERETPHPPANTLL